MLLDKFGEERGDSVTCTVVHVKPLSTKNLYREGWK